MEKFLASFLLALLILVSFVFAVRQSALDNGQKGTDLRFDDQRKRIDFKPTDEEMISGRPILVDGVITDEQADSLEIEFRYIVAPDDPHTYRISFSPPSSDFKNAQVNLKPGPNIVRATVTFDPDTTFKRLYKGTSLSFYIYRLLNENQEIQVFTRRAVFEKRWRKPRRLGFYELNPSEFYTK